MWRAATTPWVVAAPVLVGMAVVLNGMLRSKDPPRLVDHSVVQPRKYPPCDPAVDPANVAIFRFVDNAEHEFEANHWFHVGESVTAWHAQFQGINTTDVFLVLGSLDRAREFSPMTRLLTTLGIGSPRVERVHFVVGEVVSHGRWWPVHPPIAQALVRPHFTVDRSQRASQRFVQSSRRARGGDEDEDEDEGGMVRVCGVWGGDVGQRNVQRGNWFPAGSAPRFRATLHHVCGVNATDSHGHQRHARRRVLVYQRNRSRQLVHADAAVGKLRQWLPEGWDVAVMVHDEARAPCDVVREVAQSQVVLTPHGFQTMLLLFQSPPALVFEVFPFRYWKRGYDPLAVEFGVTHAFEKSPPVSLLGRLLLGAVAGDICHLNALCRTVAREFDVRVSDRALRRIANFARTLE